MFYEILKRLEIIANHPLYYLVGVAKDRIVYISTKEGDSNLWTSNLDGENRIKITKEGVLSVAGPKHRYIYTILRMSVKVKNFKKFI